MIQDIYPHHLINHYLPKEKAQKDSTVIYFEGNEVLCRNQSFPAAGELFPDESSRAKLVYLFRLDQEDFFLSRERPARIPDGFGLTDVKEFRRSGLAGKERIFAMYTAYQLYHWYRDNRYCGTCGHETELDSKERAIRCPACGRVIYPRIVPAVIVAVLNYQDPEKPRILLTKYRVGYPNYALVAGFTEIGETLEETVVREVMEETGLRVRKLHYYKSQPWAVVDDLLAGFFCEVDGPDQIRMDREELKLAEWRTRDEVVLQPDNFSLTNEMMTLFKEGREPAL